jgi:hypothetical protein
MNSYWVRRIAGRKGFTLIEFAGRHRDYCDSRRDVAPALAKAKAQAHKSLCASNGKQWGVAVNMYAGDFDNAFPDNKDGVGFSWMTAS